MLILSRKTGQQIVLPDSGVTVTVLGVSGKRVRLGVEAPPGQAVHRAEVWQRIVDLAPTRAAGPLAEHACCDLSSP